MGISKKIRGIFAALVIAIMFVTPVAASDVSDLESAIEECMNNQVIAHEMAECARALGYPEDHAIIVTASQRWWEEEAKRVDLQKELESIDIPETPEVNESDEPIKVPSEPSGEPVEPENPDYVVSSDKYKEYPYASQVWEKLKNYGYSDAVAAGILGNMMAECGGQTLNLQPFIYTRGYYGLCMWYIDYTPQIVQRGEYCRFGDECMCSSDSYSETAIVDHQLHVLEETLKKNMEYFGGDYDYFCSLTNEVDAAWYFTKYYERGGWHYIRGQNATMALEYFTE